MDDIHLKLIVGERAVPDVVKLVKAGAGRLLAAPTDFQPSGNELYDQGDSAFEPMMVVAVSLSVGALIRIVSDVILDHKSPFGELIDTRGGKLRRVRLKSQKRGTLIIKTEDGERKFASKNRKNAFDYLKAALLGLAKSE